MPNPLPKRRKNGGKFPRKKSRRRNPETGRLEKQFQTFSERWVVTTPDTAAEQMVERGLLDKEQLAPKTYVFLSEGRAMSVAAGIANNQRIAVEVAHQKLNESGEWVDADE